MGRKPRAWGNYGLGPSAGAGAEPDRCSPDMALARARGPSPKAPHARQLGPQARRCGWLTTAGSLGKGALGTGLKRWAWGNSGRWASGLGLGRVPACAADALRAGGRAWRAVRRAASGWRRAARATDSCPRGPAELWRANDRVPGGALVRQRGSGAARREAGAHEGGVRGDDCAARVGRRAVQRRPRAPAEPAGGSRRGGRGPRSASSSRAMTARGLARHWRGQLGALRALRLTQRGRRCTQRGLARARRRSPRKHRKVLASRGKSATGGSNSAARDAKCAEAEAKGSARACERRGAVRKLASGRCECRARAGQGSGPSYEVRANSSEVRGAARVVARPCKEARSAHGKERASR